MDITVALIAFAALAASWFVLPAAPRAAHASSAMEHAESLAPAA